MAAIDAQITFCCVADLDRTAAFWEGTMGLELIVDQGTCRIYRVAGGGCLGFCLRDPVPPAEGLILTIVSEDVEGWYARLRDAGVDVEHPPRINEAYGIFHFFARDPDGYRLEIQRFLSPDWSPPTITGVPDQAPG